MANNRDKRLRRKVRMAYVISTASIALVLFMLGVVSYVTLSALSAARGLQENVVLSVEMADSLFGNEQQEIMRLIEEREQTARVEYLSKEDKVNDSEFRRQFELDIDEILQAKIKKNEEKYPVEKAYGNKAKYTELKKEGR